MMDETSTATVTFLFSDVEGSTALLRKLRDGYSAVMGKHEELMRAAWAGSGRELDADGDSFFVAFGRPKQAVDAAVAHVNERKLAHLPAIRARIGRADAAVAAARLAVERAADLVDANPGDPETNRWVWRAKLLAGTTAADVAASMLEAAGTSATRRGHPLERLYRDARCGSLQPATSDVCADWLGIAALGGDPDADGSAPRW